MSALDLTATWTRLAAAALLTVVAGRYLWVTAEIAWTGPPTPPPSASAAPSGSGAIPLGSALPLTSSGKPIRVKLIITEGEDRSSVRVDGARMGQSPLLTDFSCREGETVVVELTNSKGQARTYMRPCTPGTIRVEP